ncbi:MAG: hypothetical protein VB091_01145 [Christensenella sp.]|nr:hypothetical protein [Christensenella sp.]
MNASNASSTDQLPDITHDLVADIRCVRKHANDAVFAPKALRYLDEQGVELLAGLEKHKQKRLRHVIKWEKSCGGGKAKRSE